MEKTLTGRGGGYGVQARNKVPTQIPTKGEAYQLGWELVDEGPYCQEEGATLVSALRKQGPGWARPLDPRVPQHHQGIISHTLVDRKWGNIPLGQHIWSQWLPE